MGFGISCLPAVVTVSQLPLYSVAGSSAATARLPYRSIRFLLVTWPEEMLARRPEGKTGWTWAMAAISRKRPSGFGGKALVPYPSRSVAGLSAISTSA